MNFIGKKNLKSEIINPKSQSGMAALLTIIIISAAVLLMAVTASFLGLGELELGYTSQKSGEVFSVADSCAEEAMRRLRLDQNYSGGTLNVGNGSCIISVTSDGNNRTITSVGTIDEYNKKIEVELTLSGGNTTINSWRETDD